MTISIEPSNGGYALKQDETGATIYLSSQDLISLIQSVHSLKKLALEQQPLGGVPTEIVTPVVRMSLNMDTHKHALHLGLQDHGGHFANYELPQELVRLLVERLPHYLAEMQKVSAQKSH